MKAKNYRQFLVIARCAVDDIPIRMFDLYRDAEAFAKTVKFSELKRLARQIGLDTSIWHHLQILPFDGQGRPGEYIQVRELE